MRDRWRSWTAIVAWTSLLALGRVGSGRGEDKRATSVATAGEGTPAGAANGGAPLTDEECQAFADALTKAAATGNLAAFNSAIDWDAILETATAGIDAPAAARNGFIMGVKATISKGGAFVELIVDAMKKGGSYSFLRIHPRGKRKAVLFRMLRDEGGVNYHDFALARRPDGQIRAIDIYIFLSGEHLSQTFRRLYVPAPAHDSRGILAKVAGLSRPEQEFIEYLHLMIAGRLQWKPPGAKLSKFDEMAKALREGRKQEALAIYEQLPPNMKKDKVALLYRLLAAQSTNDQAYAATMEDFRKFHPEDACVDFISVDYYMIKKQYVEAIGCVDRIDKALGGDPYLDVAGGGASTSRKASSRTPRKRSATRSHATRT